MTRLASMRTALGRPFKAARSMTTALTIAAVTAGSTLTFAAPPLPQQDAAQPAIIKVNEHHKKSHNTYSRPPAAQPQQRRKKNNNDAVAIGVGIAAVIGALALSQQANSSERSGMRQECRRLRWKCREGRGWACRKFDDMCR